MTSGVTPELNYEPSHKPCRPAKQAYQGSFACLSKYPPAQIKVVARFRCLASILFAALSSTIRLGEAMNPRPVLGNMNPTGLRGKSTDIAHLPWEVWTVQETHLTGLGIQRFKQELSSQKTNLQLTHGAAAPHRSQSLSSIGGRHTGVAVLSKYPTQQLVHHRTDQEYGTGRWLAAATCIQKRWCTVGTVYGYNENRQTLEVQQQTDQLLSKLTSRIVDGATGLRLIAGDWNLERDQIAQADYWETKGWMEAPHFAHRKWNRPIQQCTCKKTTIKDYVYLSPEILPYVQDVQLDWSTFPDHAAIMVFLSDLDSPPILPMWKKPSTIPWRPKLPNCTEWAPNFSPQEQWYTSMWQNLEQFASEACTKAGQPPLFSHQRGRATTMEVEWKPTQCAPIKPNRRGDIQSHLDTTNIKHSRWTKQTRRLEHLKRCRASSDNRTSVVEHQTSLWHKVLSAPGFAGGFQKWWTCLTNRFDKSPDVLPIKPPCFDMAASIFLDFCHHYRALEASLMKARIDQAIQRRAEDPYAIYKDLRKEPAEPVQTIVQQSIIPVQRVDTEEPIATVRLQAPLPEPVLNAQANGISVAARIIDPTTTSVDPEVAQNLQTITCQHVVGDVPTILRAFQDEWSPRWRKQHTADQEERWTVIADFVRHALPARSTSFPSITLDTWKREIRRKKSHAAIGPDAVSREDLMNMPDALTNDFLTMLNSIEHGAPWPTQMVTGIVALLMAKTATASTTGQYRQICVFSLCYRIWPSIRAIHQLLLDLHFFSGQSGPCSDGQNWISSEPEHYNHPQRVKWFAQYITNLAKTISFSPEIQQRRNFGVGMSKLASLTGEFLRCTITSDFMRGPSLCVRYNTFLHWCQDGSDDPFVSVFTRAST